jgi:hypothetical protein
MSLGEAKSYRTGQHQDLADTICFRPDRENKQQQTDDEND